MSFEAFLETSHTFDGEKKITFMSLKIFFNH